jgi:DNA-binding transcriptional ArsR family regulator
MNPKRTVANMKLYEATDTQVHAMRPDGIDGMPVLEDGGRPKQRLSRVSLKQWRLFHAVVDFDGFVGAASALHISQSSISHALAKLQDQLGITLFTLKGRKAQITDAGKVLLESSRELVRHAADVEELAENLRPGSAGRRHAEFSCRPADRRLPQAVHAAEEGQAECGRARPHRHPAAPA